MRARVERERPPREVDRHVAGVRLDRDGGKPIDLIDENLGGGIADGRTQLGGGCLKGIGGGSNPRLSSQVDELAGDVHGRAVGIQQRSPPAVHGDVAQRRDGLDAQARGRTRQHDIVVRSPGNDGHRRAHNSLRQEDRAVRRAGTKGLDRRFKGIARLADRAACGRALCDQVHALGKDVV